MLFCVKCPKEDIITISLFIRNIFSTYVKISELFSCSEIMIIYLNEHNYQLTENYTIEYCHQYEWHELRENYTCII